MNSRAVLSFIITPIIALIIIATGYPNPDSPLIGKTLAVALIMAVWWITEIVPPWLLHPCFRWCYFPC